MWPLSGLPFHHYTRFLVLFLGLTYLVHTNLISVSLEASPSPAYLSNHNQSLSCIYKTHKLDQGQTVREIVFTQDP